VHQPGKKHGGGAGGGKWSRYPPLPPPSQSLPSKWLHIGTHPPNRTPCSRPPISGAAAASVVSAAQSVMHALHGDTSLSLRHGVVVLGPSYMVPTSKPGLTNPGSGLLAQYPFIKSMFERCPFSGRASPGLIALICCSSLCAPGQVPCEVPGEVPCPQCLPPPFPQKSGQ
jgi:hypothetical protein